MELRCAAGGQPEEHDYGVDHGKPGDLFHQEGVDDVQVGYTFSQGLRAVGQNQNGAGDKGRAV